MADPKKALSEKKRRLAEQMADPALVGSADELCKLQGVPPAVLSKYLDDDNFAGYLRELIDRYSLSSLASVWGALIEKCASGDMRAIKLYFELKGSLKGGPNDASVVITGGDELE